MRAEIIKDAKEKAQARSEGLEALIEQMRPEARKKNASPPPVGTSINSEAEIKSAFNETIRRMIKNRESFIEDKKKEEKEQHIEQLIKIQKRANFSTQTVIVWIFQLTLITLIFA